MTSKEIASVVTSLKAVKSGLYVTDAELRELAMVMIAEIRRKPMTPQPQSIKER